MDKESLLKAVRFRFTDSTDVETYGSDWYVYNELGIINRPAREVMALEQEMGISVARAFTSFRLTETIGELAACWLALRLAGKSFSFQEFNPIVHLVEWEEIPEEEQGKGIASPEASSTLPTEPVSLPSLPSTESPS
jgi:hypothetical protein